MVEGEVESVRRALLRLDEALIGVIAARLGLAETLREAKRRSSAPVYDPAREVVVASLLAEKARRQGVPDRLVREVYGLLAEESRCRQLYCPEPLRVAFYGYGRMARSLARMLSRAGCWTALTGRDPREASRAASAAGVQYMGVEEALEWADILVYATPTQAVPGLVEEHASMYRESMLVADIASVKTPVVDRVYQLLGKASEPPEYVSLHPLFGPVECAAGERIAVVPVRLERWKPRLDKLLQGLGLTPVYVDADEHDRVMAVNQVLHHLIYTLYTTAAGLLVDSLGVEKRLYKELVTRSLRATEAIIARLEGQKSVIEEIRSLNPYTSDVLKALAEAVNKMAETLSGEDQREPATRKT